jgi:hypothetical protein
MDFCRINIKGVINVVVVYQAFKIFITHKYMIKVEEDKSEETIGCWFHHKPHINDRLYSQGLSLHA